jgi:predicted GIY-YIG superfamily endonuclease
VNNRTHQGNGCPKCAGSGYKVTKPGFLYLLYKNSEQKIGITNAPESRLKKHQQRGWTVLQVIGPISGQEALDRENAIKRWLKKQGKVIDGTQENWRTDFLEVQTISELEQCVHHWPFVTND